MKTEIMNNCRRKNLINYYSIIYLQRGIILVYSFQQCSVRMDSDTRNVQRLEAFNRRCSLFTLLRKTIVVPVAFAKSTDISAKPRDRSYGFDIR